VSEAVRTSTKKKIAPREGRSENVVDLEMSTGADSHMSLRLWLRLLTTTKGRVQTLVTPALW